MEVQELKTKLLATNYFINNEYLDKYCKLIETNKKQNKKCLLLEKAKNGLQMVL